MSRFINLEFGQRLEPKVESVAADETSCLREAQTAFTQGSFEAALRAFSRALEYNPRSVAAWGGQVRMLLELGEFREAKLWADKALEQLPGEPELLAAKAVALARTGDLQAALAFSDAAVEEQGSTPYVWLARGDVLLAREEKRADYCFTRALGAAPSDWVWPWLASRIHSFYRKFSLALKFVSQALALDAAQSVLWVQMGACQRALGLAGAAQHSYEQARQLNPASVEAQAALQGLRDLGLLDQLIGQFRRWLHH